MLTAASLFDGSGAFMLAAKRAGIRPVWSSEVNSYALRVTAARFPRVKQLGDIRLLKGESVPPVDVITFGSPCQDLSSAGAQSGIRGSRSSLFFEAVRLIKEMKAHSEKPRYLLWENVPGALSAGRGDSFHLVLRTLCGLAGEELSVPGPPPGGWPHAGCVLADGFSLAWRILNAALWGLAQNRRRLFLAVDLVGGSAGEILFAAGGSEATDRALRGAEQPDPARAAPLASVPLILPPEAETFLERNNRLTPHTQDKLLSPSGLARTLVVGAKDTGSEMTRTLLPHGEDLIIRRLTPDEYRRLQGMPEDWEAGVKGSDAARYRLWANAVPLPLAEAVLRGIVLSDGSP